MLRHSRVTRTAGKKLFATIVALIVGLTVLAPGRASAASAAATLASSYVNFEGGQTNPLRLSPDGTRLLAVNTPDARLSVFDVATDPTQPRLIKEIAVGIEPISCNARTNDEVWVVNQVSDSVSIVSISKGVVMNTLAVKDDPADVVFAGGMAFVSVAGNNQVRVFNATTLASLATINLTGSNPRAMAVSPDGNKVYVAFALSGNRTTIIPANLAPPQSAPTNPNLPAPPQVGLIVDATNTQWNPSVIKYTMPDNDVAEIDVASLTVTRYFPRLGTVNLAIGVRPNTGDLYVANTDARNLVHFETGVRGHIVDSRVTRVNVADASTAIVDLNPTIDYSVLPNPAARSIALAQPAGITFDPTGSFYYIAAFGTDRVAKIDAATGAVLARVEVGPASTQGSNVDPKNKRGPRGLAYLDASKTLYALNRISNTVSVINAATNSMIRELPAGSFDPTPAVIKQGRGFLYDAKLSGNGTSACAACHIDADNDRIAWDLGNPGGTMATVVNNGVSFQMHPMKGPMTTQTLRGLNTTEPFHWRGDRADFSAFNGAFDSLMGGTQLSAADMTAYSNFANTIKLPPNPNQTLDRGLPATLNGADPAAGKNSYINEFYVGTAQVAGIHCNDCHTATNGGTGTNKTIIAAQALQESQSFKVPQLRNVFAKLHFNNTAGAISIDGFGLTHDGNVPTLEAFLSLPVFVNIRNDTVRKANISAFVQCFDTGMAPAVGYARTVRQENYTDAAIVADLNTLQSQASSGNCDLIVKGTLFGKPHGLVYRPATGDYQTDAPATIAPLTQSQLLIRAQLGDVLTFMGVPVGAGVRMGVDRDLDGVFDGAASTATGGGGTGGTNKAVHSGKPPVLLSTQ